MIRPLTLVTALLVTGGLLAEPPQLEQIKLFEAGRDGYALYRVPGMVVTAKGTVLVHCEARRTGKSDWDTIDIMLRRSTDGGRTFDPRRRIANVPGPKTKNPVALAQKLADPDDITYNNCVFIPDRESLEPGYSAYSDLAVLPDGTILCIFEHGRKSKTGTKPNSYAGLTLARFNLQWLTDGQDALPND